MTNEEVVQAIYDGWARGEWDRFPAVADPELELDMTTRELNPDTYRGEEGFRRFVGEIRDLWEDMQLRPVEYETKGDRVLARLQVRLIGKGSGIAMDNEVFQVWTIRDGKAVRMKIFTDEGDARAEAGLG